MTELKLDAAHTALLVMDFQLPVLERYSTSADAALAATAAAIDAARSAGIMVIYVVVGFRPGYPEISPRNKAFGAVKAAGSFSTEIHPRVAPRDNEPIVVKHRVSAFHGTDLDMILRAHDIHTLTLCGVATSGVVLSTLRYAADADYVLTVLRDCCSDRSTEVHDFLMDKIFAGMATITTSDAFVRMAGTSRPHAK